jgi:hypothetical protein
MAPSATAEVVSQTAASKASAGRTEDWYLPEVTPSTVPRPSGQFHGNNQIDPDLLMGHKDPLKYGHSLDSYKQFDVTPNTGREFPEANLADWLRAPNSDQLIRDLAITSESGSKVLALIHKWQLRLNHLSLPARCSFFQSPE